MPAPDIVVLGSLNLDLVMRLARMPAGGETLASEESASFCGGKGANQAVACARMGASVAMIGRVGDDAAGAQLSAALAAEAIDTGAVTVSPGTATGIAVILLTEDGENRIILAQGANARLTPADVALHAGLIRGGRLMITQLEVPLDTVAAGITQAAAAGVRVLLNPAPAAPLPDGLLARVDTLIPNESEAGALSGIAVRDIETATEAARALRQKGAARVIVTLGSAGVLIADAAGTRHHPALPATVIDTTAAGDSFIGGYAAGLLDGLDIDGAAALGLRAARVCVGRQGAQASLPRRAEI